MVPEVNQTAFTLDPATLDLATLDPVRLNYPGSILVLQSLSEQLQLQPHAQPHAPLNARAADSLADSLADSQFAIALFDFDRLHQVSEGCLEFELELLTLFISDSQEHLEQLRRSLQEQNYQQLYRHAHHVKGSSANVGANGIKAIAEALEQFAQTQQVDSLETLLSRLEGALHQVQRLLEWMQQQAG